MEMNSGRLGQTGPANVDKSKLSLQKKKKKSLLQKRLFQKAENASQLLLQLIRKKHKSSFWMEQRESRTPLLVASVNILSCSFSMPQGSP